MTKTLVLEVRPRACLVLMLGAPQIHGRASVAEGYNLALPLAGDEPAEQPAPAQQQQPSRSAATAAQPAAAAAAQAAPASLPPADDLGAELDLYGDIHETLAATTDAGGGGAAASAPTSQQPAAPQQQKQEPSQQQASQQAGQSVSAAQPAPPRPPAAPLPPAPAGQLQQDGGSAVFVGNLQWWTTDVELEAACAEFGPVSAVHFSEDKVTGRSKGYARVHFADVGAAERCKGALSGSVYVLSG